MVLQHNLPSINARRHYNNNTRKLNKSLEKLSSGYAINRAGDNAAGLAVSEKMRSQIAGMTQAVKNAQDGISMIQTFEGALTETDAILQRMKTLADQMANGTYDDPVDRAAVETEYLHLCDEVDQIAETDFNGVVMLNGKPDSVDLPNDPVELPEIEDTIMPGAITCGDLTIYGDNLIEGKDYSYANNTLTILSDKQMTLSGTSTVDHVVVKKDVNANLTLNNLDLRFDDGDLSAGVGTHSIAGTCAFEIEDNSKGNVHITLVGKNTLESGLYRAGLQKSGGVDTGTLTIDGDGELNAVGKGGGAGIGGKNVQSDYVYTLASDASGCNIIINSGTINATSKKCWLRDYGSDTQNVAVMGSGAGIGGGGSGDARNITINGGKITATSDNGSGIGGGYRGALSTQDPNTWGGNAVNIIINGGIIYAEGGCDGTGTGIGSGWGGHETDITINGGKITAKGNYGGAGIGCCFPETETDYGDIPIPNSHKITITGGEVFALAMNSSHFGHEIYGAGIGAGGNWDLALPAIITISGKDTVVIAYSEGADDIGSGRSRGDYVGSDVTLNQVISEEFNNMTELGEIINDLISEEFKRIIADANLPRGTVVYGDPNAPEDSDDPNDPNNPDTSNGGYRVSIPDAFGQSEAQLTYTDHLILQVGARTKDAVDFTFQYDSDGIGDLLPDLNCSASGLGLDKLTLKTQESANYAIDKVDQALNKVNLVRATFGAVQNRLEHKIDNLNVSVENLTASESQIRDTDMPTEMMNFTKQQILAQASQSMLAQANQLPQSVLSLLDQ